MTNKIEFSPVPETTHPTLPTIRCDYCEHGFLRDIMREIRFATSIDPKIICPNCINELALKCLTELNVQIKGIEIDIK